MNRHLKKINLFLIIITITLFLLGCSFGLKHIDKNQTSDNKWKEKTTKSNVQQKSEL